MTLLVRDEEDVLEWNLRYHLSRGVDHFIVTDNLSVDGTADILHRFSRKGVVTCLSEPSDDYSQDVWVTRMAKIAQAEMRPDWIIHSDADEFWWPDGFRDLKGPLSSVSRDVQVVEVERHNFLGPRKEGDGPFFTRIVHRQTRSVNSLGRPLPRKVAHRPLEDPWVHQGNHGISSCGQRVAGHPLGGMSILHFPARTARQLCNKIAKGGAAYERNTRLSPQTGDAWRAMYRDLQSGRAESVLENHFVDSTDPASLEGLVEDRRLLEYMAGL